MNTDRQKHPRLTAAAFILLFFLCLGAGASAILQVEKGRTLLGAMIGAGAVAVAFLSARSWLKVLPGIFGVAALNTVAVVASGHKFNSPVQPFPRLDAAACFILFVAAASLSKGIRSDATTLTVRAALLGAWGFLVFAIASDRQPVSASAGIVCCVAVARWSANRRLAHPAPLG